MTDSPSVVLKPTPKLVGNIGVKLRAIDGMGTGGFVARDLVCG